MTSQQNAENARKVYELFNAGQLEEAAALATDDVEVVLVPFGQTFKGREGFVGFMRDSRMHSPTST